MVKLNKNRCSKPKSTLFSLWKDDIYAVFTRDPAARSFIEVLTTYPGVHAILAHRFAHQLWQMGWFYPARILAFFIRLESNIDIHPAARIGRRFFIDHGAGVVIGETAEIGDDVTLYHGVTLGGTTWNTGKRHPTLRNHVLVGAGAKILGPITIGKHSRVGANSVVIDNVPAYSTVVGIPGKIVRNKAGSKPILKINLNHHLVPDPVGNNLDQLLEKINQLEVQIKALASELDQQHKNQTAPEFIHHNDNIAIKKTG